MTAMRIGKSKDVEFVANAIDSFMHHLQCDQDNNCPSILVPRFWLDSSCFSQSPPEITKRLFQLKIQNRETNYVLQANYNILRFINNNYLDLKN
jgi:hypothetical protein